MPKAEIRRDEVKDLDILVDRWFHESFHGSVVARSTDIWNHVQGAKEDLKRRLASTTTDPATD